GHHGLSSDQVVWTGEPAVLGGNLSRLQLVGKPIQGRDHLLVPTEHRPALQVGRQQPGDVAQAVDVYPLHTVGGMAATGNHGGAHIVACHNGRGGVTVVG